MSEDWRRMSRDSTSPASDIVPVDLSSTDHTPDAPYRAIKVTTGGIVVFDTLLASGRSVTMLDGDALPVYVRKIYKTGTTATGILGFV